MGTMSKGKSREEKKKLRKKARDGRLHGCILDSDYSKKPIRLYSSSDYKKLTFSEEKARIRSAVKRNTLSKEKLDELKLKWSSSEEINKRQKRQDKEKAWAKIHSGPGKITMSNGREDSERITNTIHFESCSGYVARDPIDQCQEELYKSLEWNYRKTLRQNLKDLRRLLDTEKTEERRQSREKRKLAAKLQEAEEPEE